MDIFIWTSTACSLVSVLMYLVFLIGGKASPNPATWGLWLGIGFINLLTYFLAAGSSLYKVAPLITVLFGIFCISIYSLLKGRFNPLKFSDKICFALASLTLVIWKLSRVIA